MALLAYLAAPDAPDALDAAAVAVAVAAAVALAWLAPGVLRPVWRVLLAVVYRFRVYDRHHVPKRGPVLVVANHVSYLDWMLLWAACPRAVTFVLWGGYYRNPLLRLALSFARNRTIRLDDRTGRPHAVADGLQRVADALDAGRAVVLFPEGGLTLNGNMRPFGRGVESVLKRATKPVTVVPAAVDGMWGSLLGYRDGRVVWKRPRGLRRPVAVLFGRQLVSPSPLAGEGRGGARGVRGEDSLPMGGSDSGLGALPLTRLEDSPPSPARGEGDPAARPGVRSPERAVPTAAELHLAVQEARAECAIRQADTAVLVHRRFVRTAVRFRNLFRPCVIDNATGTERTLTWGKTFVAAVCVARYLRPRVAECANVGIWLPTSLGGALANVALAFLGKTTVNLNYTAGSDPVRSAARQAGLTVVVTSKKFLHRVPLDLPDDVRRVFLEDVLESVTAWQRIRTFLTALVLPGWAIERFVLGITDHVPDDVLTIVFSSGSTGEPKGVVLTHRNVATNIGSSIDTIGFRPSDRLLATLPFFHSFGYAVCLWAPLAAGAVAVFHPDPRQAKEVGDLARKHACTLFLSTATFLRFYLRRCDAGDFRAVRILVCGAEKLPVKLQDEFRDKFGVLPLEGYGCTELSPVVSTNLHDANAGGARQTCNTPGTIGQPIFGVCAKAFDPDTGAPLPPGAEGVLWVKGPNVMAGYLHQPDKTKAVVRDGWYNTGDRGVVEAAGFLRITGRVSRFAKIGGEMVPLERLEEELHDAHGGGGDRVLAVAAVPDEKRGERLVVLYLPELAGKVNGLLDLLAKRGLPNLWVPDGRDCFPVDALPLLGSGKLDLKKVAEVAKAVSAAAAKRR